MQGEGPIHLIGSHCIDFFDNMAGEADSEGEDEEMEVSFSSGVLRAHWLKELNSRSRMRKGKRKMFLLVLSK